MIKTYTSVSNVLFISLGECNGLKDGYVYRIKYFKNYKFSLDQWEIF